MAGGSKEHARLQVRIGGILDRDHPNCKVYSSDLKLYIAELDRCVYPDCTVICGEPETADKRNHVVTNPTVLVEVLSPFTEHDDLMVKVPHYMTIPGMNIF